MSSQHSTNWALRWLGFRQTIKGALIIGGLAGFLIAVQGLAFAATYTTAESRHQLASSLEGAPVLGILYGEINDLATPGKYMVYRVLAVMTLIAAIWALTASTKLLRGQEEDGRLELVASGTATKWVVARDLMIGFAGSIVIAYTIATIATACAGMSPNVNVTLAESSQLTMAIFLPTLLFAALGATVSQLTVSRRRALFYGFIVLVILFGLRALGNAVDDAHFLKSFTPFGWSDLINPIVRFQPGWILPFIVAIPFFTAGYLLLSKMRDIGTGILPESTTAKSRFFLLKSPFLFAIRQNSPTTIAWIIAAAALSILMASIATIATDALADSEALTVIIAAFGNANDLTIAFMGAGLVFTVILLLIMTTVAIGSICNDESHGYLDTILAQPVGRASWLTKRLLLAALTSIATGIVSCVVTWAVASTQNIPIVLGDILLVGIALSGTVLFTIGFGTLLYGIVPRIATAGMYTIIAWSAIIDMIRSSIEIDEWIVRTSLFHYVSISPVETPDWTTFTWLASLGAAMAVVGVICFSRRDIVSE